MLYTEMQQAMQEIALENGSVLQKAERNLRATEAVLTKLKALIKDYPFLDKEEEINFFRHIKPRFHKELFYWTELIYILTDRPVASEEEVRRYWMRILGSIDLFLERNQVLYTYYRFGHSYQDEQLFLRDRKLPAHPLFGTEESDPAWSTAAGTTVARIMAMEEVIQWIDLERNRDRTPVPASEQLPKLSWTGSKAQLIELVYALESFGVFNNGKTNVKEVMEYFQHCFNVQKVSNYYGYFQGMRIRKKDRTPFLNGLIEHTIRRMDESDEFPRFA